MVLVVFVDVVFDSVVLLVVELVGFDWWVVLLDVDEFVFVEVELLTMIPICRKEKYNSFV